MLFFGNDDIMGGDRNDTIYGHGGSDRLSVGNRNDSLFGGALRDLIDGGEDNDTIFGGDEDGRLGDVITGGSGNDSIFGDGGNDNIDGGADNDDVFGGDANDALTGLGGIDLPYGGTNNDTPHGHGPLFEVPDEAASDILHGDAGDDPLIGDGGADFLYGGDDDQLHGGHFAILPVVPHGDAAGDQTFGGAGDDTICADAGPDLDDGDADFDLVIFRIGATDGIIVDLRETGPQLIAGGFGIKTLVDIERVERTDFLDLLTGNAANNLLRGLEGADQLVGGNGDDVLRGDLGEDHLEPRRGRDQVFGGPDIDRVGYAGITRGGRVDLSLTDFQNTRGAGSDRIVGVEDLEGGKGSDTLLGNGDGNGLRGLAGRDRIFGGLGGDGLRGGRGADTFIYRSLAESAASAPDKIVDFRRGQGGRIDLSRIEDASCGGISFGKTFIGSAAFDGLAGSIRATAGLLQLGIDGDRVADLEIATFGVTIRAGGRIL